ncbi:putative ATP/GTP-binding protein [Catenulispora acidiphila DSM 44928]|uniref:Putative ATP/GTP-binding protein n=1 Tax=Catenulispora acidiphila (strain DSM 44928 / JCM 14897 / NBRC 102108 / NRRL B-24433 / ID139908) TaxID=479433 RepID=C7PXB0_CATAD|nr:FxSxx-COOH system tetratricopeptide repeat protein [Catenulispora acidiphila]ACU69461.1 putative ATP/GTP-binding protein [Catenulispora acidiphila DSM 44928]
MPEREGRVLTFYSYKGGCGRTMALANTAWILAANGRRVAVIDWDLESPGLHRYFPAPVLDPTALNGNLGVIDMVRDFEWAASRDEVPDPAQWYMDNARIRDLAISLRWPFPGGGCIHFVSAGLQNRAYSAAVGSLDWDRFYADLGGGRLFDAMRRDMIENYDYTLIDSRTGFSDVADICTIHLPDVLVDCFTLNNQSIEGAAKVARSVHEHNRRRAIRILPVPMRVDDGEKEKADAGRAAARARFEGFPQVDDPADAVRYWGAVEIPYRPFYAYEETLAVFGDSPGLTTSLLAAYERLTGELTGGTVTSLPPIDDTRRISILDIVTRRRETVPEEVTVAYIAEDRMWADWTAGVLRRSGVGASVRVLTPGIVTLPADGQRRRVLAIASTDFAGSGHALAAARTLAGPEQLTAVLVSEPRADDRLGGLPSVDLHGLPEGPATARLLRALGKTDAEAVVSGVTGEQTGGARFPAATPRVWSAPGRNATFTGRDAMLEKLRDGIVGSSSAVILPLALHGLGGVGKTQLALEYAHRFKADYDLVWWIEAEQPDFIDTSLADLAIRLGLRGGDNVPEAAEAAREALRRGTPYNRWLVVYDNALEPEVLTPYLPDLPGDGTGHILITSRIQSWSRVANSLEVDVFTPEESVRHLTRAVPGLAQADAAAIAELVDNLPLAVESAASWLATTGTPVATYLESLAEETTRVLSLGRPETYPVSLAVTWNLALQRLREREPAATRLLELAAFMNPDGIAMDLVQSDEMVIALHPFNEFVTERMVIGNVVREIVVLSLIKVDPNTNALRMHRLVQEAVKATLDDGSAQETIHEVHRILAGARPQFGDTDNPENWPRYQIIWPHLSPSRAIDCEEEPVRQLLIDRVRFLWKTGDYAHALDFGRTLEKRWAERIEDYGSESTAGLALNRQFLNLRCQLATVLRLRGEFRWAYDLDVEVLAEQQRVLPPRHPHTLLTAIGLAADLRGLGRFDDALEMDKATYADHKQAFWEDHPRALLSAHNLAVSYRLVGDFAQARAIDQDTLNRRKAVLGDRHPAALFSAAHLARDLRETGHFEVSVELLRSTLADYRDVVGENAPETLRTAKSLAVSLRKADHLEEALALSRDTYEHYLADYAPHNPDVLACAVNLAADFAATGDARSAVKIMDETLRAYRENLGRDHPYTLVSLNNLGAFTRQAGIPDRARRHIKAAHGGFDAWLGPEHPYTLAAAANLTNSMVDAGELEEAETMELAAAGIFEATLGADHPDTLAVSANRVATLKAMAREAEANTLRAGVMAALERTLGAEHGITRALAEGRRLDFDLEPQPT